MNRSSIERLFLVHHTHMDVGYTDLAAEVRNQHLSHLDHVLALCQNNANKPQNERFFWTCESALLVRDYMEARPRHRVAALLEALRQGWVELQAFLTQPLTELASAQELVDCLGYACDLGRREGFGVSCGMIDDIGGYAGRLPSIMAQLNVRYLVAGVGAFQVHLPWAGLPHLFYLRAADGARVLVWNLGIDRRKTPQQMEQLAAVYGQGAIYLVLPFQRQFAGKETRGVEVDQIQADSTCPARARFAELEERLAAEQYPFPDVMLQYGGDNRGPDPSLVPLLNAVRSRGDMPDIRFTTPVHFFRHMEQHYGARIPVVDGVITDPWNLRANPAPATLRRHREAQRLMEAVEARAALQRASRRDDDRRVREAGLLLQLGSDHTCGLSEWGWERAFSRSSGCGDKDFDRYRQSWEDKRQYAELALRSLREIDRVQRQRLASRAGSPGPLVAVWNDASVPHGGECELYLGRDGAGLSSLRDAASGAEVGIQPLGGNGYLIDSPEVPSYGVRFLRAVVGAGGATVCASEAPCHLTGGGLELRVEPATGRIQSLRLVSSGTELLDAASAACLGQVVCHDLQGVSHGILQAGMQQDCGLRERPSRFVGIEAGPAGPLFSSCIISDVVDGPRGPMRIERSVRLYRATPRVDVLVRLEKPENENKESVSVVFPWAGRKGVFVFDQNVGAVAPAHDLAPGAMQDLFHCFSWAHLWAGQWGITLACPDAPIMQFGGLRFMRWGQGRPFVAESNHVLCQLYHNLLNTDCPIWQSVSETFRFSLFVHAGQPPSTGQCHRLAAAALPLKADYLSVPSGRASRSFSGFQVTPDSIRVLSVRGSEARSINILVENTAGTEARGSVEPGIPVHQASLVNLDGTLIGRCVVDSEKGCVGLVLQPHQLATLRISP